MLVQMKTYSDYVKLISEKKMCDDNGLAVKKDTNNFETMTSMRNVDTTVAGNVIVWED